MKNKHSTKKSFGHVHTRIGSLIWRQQLEWQWRDSDSDIDSDTDSDTGEYQR